EVFDEAPAIELEIVLRVQRLVHAPDPAVFLAVVPRTSPPIGKESLERTAPSVEIAYKDEPTDPTEYAIEITYEGLYELAEETFADGSSQLLDEHFGAMSGWIAPTLGRLGDLRVDYLPPDDDE